MPVPELREIPSMTEVSMSSSRMIKCRIWWPTHIVLSDPPSSSCLLLFGWFVSDSESSVDVVVAFAVDEKFLDRCPNFDLEEAIHNVNQGMPVSLQDISTFSLLGCCGNNFDTTNTQMVNGNERQIEIPHEGCYCGGLEFTGLQKYCRQPLLQKYRWIQVVCDPWKYSFKENSWIPKFHQMNWNGRVVSQCDLHVVLYETPTFGGHHFSLSYSSLKHVKDHPRRPRWLDDLYLKHQNLELDTVILALNSTAAASMLFKRYLGQERSCRQSPIIYMILEFFWNLLAAMIALFGTIPYIILQFLSKIKSFGSKCWISHALAKTFSCTGKNVQIRCCQFLYWPIFLNETDFRSQSCAEYAEKAALKKHSLWSSILVDALLGNLVGLTLIFHAESVCGLILSLASQTTDHILRSGSVWLMGVPAGFKLNTELAGVLGMISLNAIQIWSTLWFYAAYIFYHVIVAAALSGMLFGWTVPAAFIVDVIAIVAAHVAALHWLCSLLYSCQIQALSSLWRLFRGRKWNPLRRRLDSYEYTVEQHIVGSLLFTPLLLLLPTTSVFYIFFTIVNTTIIGVLLVIEMTISVIHATPYNKILMWLFGSRRFPSGIWFELIWCQNDSVTSLDIGFHENVDHCGNGLQDKDPSGDQFTMVSFLHSNYLTFGQVVWPHFRNICSELHKSLIASSIHGILTGKRIPTKMIFGLPSPLPWMSIPYEDYWCICYNSVLSFLQTNTD